MIRISAAFVFLVTLLCPIFCLAEVDRDCSDHGQSSGGNCEAMTVGAVVAKAEIGPTSLSQLLPCGDRLLITETVWVGTRLWSRGIARNRATKKPPPASTRQALLQIFLF